MKMLDAIIAFVGVVLVGLLGAGALMYKDHVYYQGYDAAVAAGEAELARVTQAARQTELDLRGQLRARDADAFLKEQDHAESLQAAQRRVRAGTDRLRCPAGPVPDAAAPGDRPAAAGPALDGGGPDLVPEAAADVLGHGAAIAGLVRRYERLEQRFDACEALTRAP
jgi:hypothetical protein